MTLSPMTDVLLRSGAATGITAATPWQLRNLPGGFSSLILKISELTTTSGITSFSVRAQVFNGTAIVNAANSYSSSPLGAAKFTECAIAEGIANDTVGSIMLESLIELIDFTRANRLSKIKADSCWQHLNSTNAAQRVQNFHSRLVNNADTGLNLYPTANTLSFNWQLIGKRT